MLKQKNGLLEFANGDKEREKFARRKAMAVAGVWQALTREGISKWSIEGTKKHKADPTT